MDPGGILRGASFRERWLKLESLREHTFLHFVNEHLPWLGTRDLSQFREIVGGCSPFTTTTDCPRPVDPADLASVAVAFHQSHGTLSPAVQRSLKLLCNGATTARVAHQPNFLPSFNVALQPAVLDALCKDSLAECQILLIVDYDSSANRRYRNAFFPSASCRSGYISITAPASRLCPNSLMYFEAPPSLAYLARTIDRIRQVALFDLNRGRSVDIDDPKSQVRRDLEKSLDELGQDLTIARASSVSLCDFNAAYLSRVVNKHWGLATVFMSGMRCLPLMSEHIEYLWTKAEFLASCQLTAAQILESAGLIIRRSLVRCASEVPFWLICECSSRVNLHWVDRQGESATGCCGVCDQVHIVRRACVKELVVAAKLVPRVTVDDLLDGFAWDHHIGCGYRGALEHHVFSSLVGELMGIRRVPDFLSRRGRDFSVGSLMRKSYYARLSSEVRDKVAPANLAAELLAAGRGSVAHSAVWGVMASLAGNYNELLAE